MSKDLKPIKVPEETPLQAYRFLKDIKEILARLANQGLDIPSYLLETHHKDEDNQQDKTSKVET